MFMMASMPTAWASLPVQAPRTTTPGDAVLDELVQLVEPELLEDDLRDVDARVVERHVGAGVDDEEGVVVPRGLRRRHLHVKEPELAAELPGGLLRLVRERHRHGERELDDPVVPPVAVSP
jgi:hypothetical protein